MKIRVLGCSGAEFPGHNPPGFLLNDSILFDAGSLTNVLQRNSQMKIRHIFITHAHLDHIRGIPFLADNLIGKNRREKVSVMSIPSVIATIKKNLLNSSVWPDFTEIPNPDNPILSLVSVKAGKPVLIQGYTITPTTVHHSVPAVGYLVEDSRQRRFFYTGDTGPTDATWKKIGNRPIHCIIIEVSFPNAMEEIALTTGHMTARLLEREFKKMKLPPERIFITHTKPQYARTIRAEIKALRMKNLFLLKDGDTISV